MTTLRFSLLIAVLLTGPALAAPVAAFPRISEAKDAKACRQALAVAQRASASRAPKPADAAPVILTDKKPDFGILLAPEAHNPEGDDMIVDEAAVQQENGGRFKSLYLPKATGDFRFVVTQQKMNWQGDFFGLYLVDASRDADQTAELIAGEAKGDRKPAQTVFKDSWQRPWLIRDPDSGDTVALDTQHPAEFLADWIVYRNANGTAEVACRIAFRPAAKQASDLLPAGALRDLAAVLDEIVGVPSQSEGTLQPTARVRLAARWAWANTALRPWALEEPYNSEKEIAEGLRAWTKRSPVYRARYQRMRALLPKAELSLAAHYQKALRKSPAEAGALAKQALVRVVGAHFVFGKKGD